MLPHSPPPPSFSSIHRNQTNILTSTLPQQLFINISQSILFNNNDNNLNLNDAAEGDGSLVRYKTLYRDYHGIISSFVCVFGLTCNLFNIIILTRPLMRSTTNTILTSLALSDLLKMSFVLPAAILFYCLPASELKSEPDFTSHFQVTFYMIQMLFTLTLHCISTWLTVLLAAFRYIFLRCKTLAAFVSSPDRALFGVSIVVMLSTILCIPSYIEHRIVKTTVDDDRSSINNQSTPIIILYRFEETQFSKRFSLRETVFVLHAVMFKLIPCILLLLFSFLLIQELRQALHKSEALQRHSASSSNSSKGRARGRRREKENRRTTLMLVIVCVLFLVTELPQGAILFMSFLSKKNSKFYYQIYQQLGDTFDILALINNSVNFILYCSMSRAFRDTFKQTFCCFCSKNNRRESDLSVATLTSAKRSVQYSTKYENRSIAYDTITNQNCSDDYRTSIIQTTTSSKSDEKLKRIKQTLSLRDKEHLNTLVPTEFKQNGVGTNGTDRKSVISL